MAQPNGTLQKSSEQLGLVEAQTFTNNRTGTFKIMPFKKRLKTEQSLECPAEILSEKLFRVLTDEDFFRSSR